MREKCEIIGQSKVKIAFDIAIITFETIIKTMFLIIKFWPSNHYKINWINSNVQNTNVYKQFYLYCSSIMRKRFLLIWLILPNLKLLSKRNFKYLMFKLLFYVEWLTDCWFKHMVVLWYITCLQFASTNLSVCVLLYAMALEVTEREKSADSFKRVHFDVHDLVQYNHTDQCAGEKLRFFCCWMFIC